MGTDAGVRDGAATVDIRGGSGVSTRVVAEEGFGVAAGLGVGVNVVSATGSGDTGTVFSAARNASADWNRSAGSLAIAIIIISFSEAGRSSRKVIGGVGTTFRCAVINEYCESLWNGNLPVSNSYSEMPNE